MVLATKSTTRGTPRGHGVCRGSGGLAGSRGCGSSTRGGHTTVHTRGGPATRIRGRGRARGSRGTRGTRGSSGSGRTPAPKRPRNFIASRLPWEKLDSNTDQSPSPLVFTSQTGPNVPLTPTSHLEDFFDHFFDQDFLGLILEETNR